MSRGWLRGLVPSELGPLVHLGDRHGRRYRNEEAPCFNEAAGAVGLQAGIEGSPLLGIGEVGAEFGENRHWVEYPEIGAVAGMYHLPPVEDLPRRAVAPIRSRTMGG